MRDFPEGRAPTVEGKGAIIWHNFFPENCMKMIKNWIGKCVPRGPRSATVHKSRNLQFQRFNRYVVQFSPFLSNMQN